MHSKDLLDRMLDPAAAMPCVRDIPAAFALQLANVAHKLTEEEIQGFVELGAVISQRTTRLVPILGTVGD